MVVFRYSTSNPSRGGALPRLLMESPFYPYPSYHLPLSPGRLSGWQERINANKHAGNMQSGGPCLSYSMPRCLSYSLASIKPPLRGLAFPPLAALPPHAAAFPFCAALLPPCAASPIGPAFLPPLCAAFLKPPLRRRYAAPLCAASPRTRGAAAPLR